MIVPRTQLIVLTALLVVPCAAVAGLLPQYWAPMALVIAVFAGTAVADGLWVLPELRQCAVSVREVVRLTCAREGVIPLHFHCPGEGARRIQTALALPRCFSSPERVVDLRLPEGKTEFRYDWPCRPRVRGRFLVTQCNVQVRSRLGFWDRRLSKTLAGEVRVYPNLVQERKPLAALFLNRGLGGFHVQRQVGQGREFEKLRAYMPGDTFADIHWKTSAKRGVPITREYQIERTQRVYVVLDMSRLSGRPLGQISEGGDGEDADPPSGHATPTNAMPILDQYLTSALLLAQVAGRQGDLFGVATFSDRVQNFLRAGGGAGHYNRCREALYNVAPQPVNPDFNELFPFLKLRLRRRALIIFLTSLDDPVLSEEFSEGIHLLSRQHHILVNMVRPPEVNPLFHSAPDSVEDIYRQLAGHLQWRQIMETGRRIGRQGAHLSLLESEKLSVQLASQYIRVKQRQIL